MLVTRLSLAAVALASATVFAFTAMNATAADGPSISATRIGDLRNASGSPQCLDRIVINPVAQMTYSGTTLLGGWQLSTISIFSNGLVTVSQVDGASGSSSAGQALVDPQYVADLRNDLRELGAHRMCDARFEVYDAPLTTVTVFSGGQNARAHTYSYWIPTGEYQPVDDAITNFLAEHVLVQLPQ